MQEEGDADGFVGNSKIPIFLPLVYILLTCMFTLMYCSGVGV